MKAKHVFGRGAVVLVSLALVALVAVTTVSTNASTAAPVYLYWTNSTLGWDSKPAATASRAALAPGTPHLSGSRPKDALPQELSFDANGSVVLLRRDGRRLPFLSGIFQPRGERQRHLYAGREWSPDGSKLLAQRWGYGLRALEVTDETGKLVWTVAGRYVSDGRWSRDGTRIAFVHVYPEPALDYVLFVASSDRRVLTRIQAHVREFSWSPDGTKLAYPVCAGPCGPSRAEGAHRLVIADASGRRAPHTVPLPAGAGAPGRTLTDVQWSPDGSLIAFVSHDDVGMHLNVVHPDGSSLRRVADGDLNTVQWSPDGSLIAFVSHDDVGWHLDVVNPDGSSLRRVADDPFYWGPYEWSPDGKRIAIVVPTGPRSRDVSVVNADGTDLHRIARCRCDLRGGAPISESVAWSLEGTRIAYISGRGNTISTIRPDGSGATVVATQPARGVTGYWYPSSPLWRPTARALTRVTSLPVALAIAAASVAGALATSSHATPPLDRQTYTRELQKLADRHSGAVAIVVTPEGTWKGAAGWADSHAKRRADPDDRFAIESTTKTFVATVVLQLVGERRLDLHDTVQQWLPGLFPADPRITIRQLLNHSSGIPSDFAISEAPLVRAKRIAAQGVLFRPGTSSAYSNSDFVLLGLIVEKVTGRPLDQVVTSRIIRRLHLRGTSYGTAHAQRMTPWLGPVESFGRPVSGDGGIISTVDDLATFFRALLGGKLLPRKQLAEMTRTIASPEPDLRFGLGILRYRQPCGFAWGHGGIASYQVDVHVARDGSKAVVWARNNPAPSDWSFGDRLYCA